jgi:lysozyme
MAKFDDIKDKGLLSGRGEELLRSRQERLQQKSVEEVRVIERIAQDAQKIDSLISNMEMAFKERMEAISAISARQEELRKLAERLERGRVHGVEKGFQGSVRSALGSRATTEDIAGVYRSSSTLGPAISAAQSYSTQDLEAQVARGRHLLQRQEGRILETSGQIGDPGGEQRFRLQMQTRQRIIEDIGTAQAAMQAQKKLGIDTQSQYFGAAETARRVSSERERAQIREDVMAGRSGTRGQVEKGMEEAGKRLIETFAKLEEAIKSGAKNVGELSKEFKDLEKEYDKHGATLAEMNRQGVGGGGGIAEGISKAFGVIGDLGVIAQGIGQGYRYNTVTSELAQGQQRIGFANLANQRFDDLYGATQGDMSALRRTMSGAYGEQVRRGLEFGGREDAALLMEMGGKGAQLSDRLVSGFDPKSIAGAARFGGGVGVAGYLASAAPEVGAAATPDALQLNRMMTDYRKQITQSQAFLSSSSQMRELQDAISKIDDFSAQSTFDYTKSLTLATRGLGVGQVGEGYYNPTTMRGSGRIGGGRAVSASTMGDISSQAQDVELQRVLKLKDSFNAVADGSVTEEQKDFMRSQVDPKALQRMKHLIAGKQGRTGMEAFKNAFGFGPSDDEYIRRGIAAGVRPASPDAPAISAGAEPTFDTAKQFIKRHEGLSLNAYRDTSRGYSIGYGHFVPGSRQKGKSITREEAEALFEKDFASHSGQVNKMLGPDVLKQLNEGQRGALYSMAYNAGPGSLKYGGKDSVLSRLQRGDISGAGTQILNTAITSDGQINPALQARRRDEYRMFSGQSVIPKDVQLQDVRSEGMSSEGVAGGGRRQSLQELLSDPAVVGMIARRAGLGTKDIPRLVGAGVSALGTEMAGEGGVNSIVRAGELSRIGYMQSPEQYFQARGALTGVGGGSEDMERILKNAVAAGMDSSKNIMEMVQATTSMARVSATAGISAVGGASQMLGLGVQQLRGQGVSANMAVGAAQFAAGRIEDISTSKDLDMFNVMEFARLRQGFEGASMQQLQSMQTASPQELRQLRGLFQAGKSDEAEEMAIKMGLHGQVSNAGDVDKLLDITNEQALGRTMGFGTNVEMEKSIREKRKKGQPLSKEERSFLSGMGRLTQGREYSADAGFAMLNTQATAAEGTLATAPGGIVASGEQAIGAGAISDANVFADGVSKFKEAIGGLEALGPAMTQFAESVDPSKFAEATKQAADNLSVPINQFSDKLAEFNTTVGNFTRSMGSLVDRLGKMMGNGSNNINGNANPKQSRSGGGGF